MTVKPGLTSIFFVFAFLALAGAAFACTVSSITTSSTASTATVGTNVVLSSTLVGSESSCVTSQIRLISTSGSGSLTVNDPASPGYYTSATISNTGTVKTFTVTAGAADTYSYYVQGTTSEGSTTSTPSNIQYTDTSAVTVSGTPSVASILTTGTTTINITLTNTQASDIATSYGLSYDSGVATLSGDATSDTVTISAGSQRALQFTVTPVTAGTATVTMSLGSTSNAFTSTITITAPSTGTTTTTTGGSSGHPATTTTTTVTTTVSAPSTVLDATNTYPVAGNDIRTGRTASVSATQTDITVTVTNQGNTVAQLDLNELVPLTIASPSQITFSSDATISQTDTGTSALWQVTLLPRESKTITYTLAKVLTGAQVSAIASTVTATAAAPAAGKAIPISLMVDSTVVVGKEIILTAIDPTNTRLLKGVEITVTKPSGKTVSITTDASGKASFVADEDGIYKYSVGASYSLQAGSQTVATQPAATTPPRKPPATAGSTAPPAATSPPAEGGFPWLLVIVAVVIVAIVGAVVLLGGGVLLFKKKGI